MSSRSTTCLLVFIALAACCQGVLAQPVRGMQNGGFDTPQLSTRAQNPPANSCWLPVQDIHIPGWTSTAVYANTPATIDAMCNPLNLRPAPGSTGIELWRNGFSGLTTPSPGNLAELGRDRYSQSVCFLQGETIAWSFSHRGRNGQDTASFDVDDTANRIVLARTGTGGGGAVDGCGGGLVTSATCSRTSNANTGWASYSGSFVWSGGSGEHSVGITGISAVGPAGQGNLVDSFVLTQQPLVEFSSGTSTGVEAQASAGLPEIVVTGNVTAALVVTVAVQPASTATLGTDFTTPGGSASFSVTVPAGNYDGGTGSRFATGIQVVNDGLVEDNETIVLQLPASANYLRGSTTACGAPAIDASTYFITDNDVDLATSKQLLSATPNVGGQWVLDATYWNNTAQPTVGDLAAHDATGTISLPVPSGFAGYTWTCTATGTPAPACPAASGNGPINATVALPAGTGGSEGGRLAFTLTATLAVDVCDAITSIATISAPDSPRTEASAKQADFASPAPGGTANNSAAVSIDPVCADLSILASAPASVATGAPITYTLVITNNGPDGSSGATVVDTPDPQLDCEPTAPVSCSGVACPGALTLADLTSGVVLGTLPSTAPDNTVTLSYVCVAP